MKTILVLAQHPETAESVRAGLDVERYRVIHRRDVEEAEPFLRQAFLDACIVDIELRDVQGIWVIERLKRRLPTCPVLVYTGNKQWEWEEEAFLQGVEHVLTKPVRARLLNALLDRLWMKQAPGPAQIAAIAGQMQALPYRAPSLGKPVVADPSGFKALEVLRDSSAILTHSLCAEALLKQFLLLLREIIGVNRAAVFLRKPFGMFGEVLKPEETRGFRSACAIGLSPGLLEHFELSFEAGIGGFLFRQGRILRRDSEEAHLDIEMQKEFELLGAQVAIPILDRETLVGVAAFDGRVTGAPLADGELELIFHLLEDLGLAIKNIWLHDQLVSNHEMMADILSQLNNGCIVVSSDLNILHANKTAHRYFARAGHRGAGLEFNDLPQTLGSKVYQVLKTGAGISTFKYSPPDSPTTVYRVNIVPFQRQNSLMPNSALLVVEDHSQSEQLQSLEIETANLRLITSMAERLAHEIGNSIVSLSTHQQLLQQKYDDPEFRQSLTNAMAESVKRISRLAKQMLFLARDDFEQSDLIPIKQLVEEAFHEAQNFHSGKVARLHFDNKAQPLTIPVDHAGLKHALSEVMLNALQASQVDSQVTVNSHRKVDATGKPWVEIEITDRGPGFTRETAAHALDPFYTTRNVGIGLGLTVARRIVEKHRGKIEILPSENSGSNHVVISLPAE
jgi:nitrogen-specific signal transduction histidine kinase/CheY-like chemotaxis protein